jgi:hypothetical protein
MTDFEKTVWCHPGCALERHCRVGSGDWVRDAELCCAQGGCFQLYWLIRMSLDISQVVICRCTADGNVRSRQAKQHGRREPAESEMHVSSIKPVVDRNVISIRLA